ncbi:MAG: sigma 54-interacting transcriptional regulator [Desulfosarcinaceae bacterium]
MCAASPDLDYLRLLNQVPLGILLLDNRRRVIFYNRALETIIGLPAAMALGLPCYHVLRSRLCLHDCPACKTGQPDKVVCGENDLINRDRKLVQVRITLARTYNQLDQPCGYIETVEDLSLSGELDHKDGLAYSFGHIIGKSAQMEKLFAIMPVIAQSDASVLITGETGTGKDMLAEALHQSSDRAKGPFIKINCGALPETLLESELFGHTKGAFTGAMENKQGRFRLAHNGTLYLTEIGDLPLPLQVKLLTFLDDKVVYPLGSTKGFVADVRIVAATHRNLEQMVQEGRFRQDLFYRLNVLRVHIPAVREREGDVRLLLDYFLNFHAQKLDRSISGFSPRALKMLMGYTYPGNVREMRNIIEYAVNVCKEDKILPKHLPNYLAENKKVQPEPQHERQSRLNLVPASTGENGSWPAMEKRMILDALITTKGSRSRAAELLGWARTTLWRKMKQYGIDAP